MDKKELMILSHLRRDARKSLVDVANETGIPISTVYDKVRRYEGGEDGGIIKKHTCILDFQKLGFNIRAVIIAKLKDEKKLKEFAHSHRSINSVFKLNERGRFMFDVIFMHMAEMEDFLQRLDECRTEEKSMHFISEEIVREKFLT